MKYLLILLAVLAGVWIWRNSRREALRAQQAARKPAPPQLQDMVRCSVCGVHLPATDAVAVRSGVFCCPEHQKPKAGR